MKRFISFSGGVESTTMCILYGKGATAIWCDTGDEEPEMYERIAKVEKELIEIHDGDFRLVKIYPEIVAKGKVCHTIEEAALAWSFYAAANARWCTSKFKIEPIDLFLMQQGPCELLIGFNADEEPEKDRTGNFMECDNVDYRYPLYEDGFTRYDCEETLRMHRLLPNFPIYMKRGGCRKCFFRGKGEMKAKYIFNPTEFAKDKAFENHMNDVSDRKKFYHINMNAGASYQSIEDEVNREIAQWGIDEVKRMYKSIETHKACGAFCHR